MEKNPRNRNHEPTSPSTPHGNSIDTRAKPIKAHCPWEDFKLERFEWSERIMKCYGIFVQYAEGDASGERIAAKPLIVEAANEEEACRAATLLADFIFDELKAETMVRVTGPTSGQVVGEIQRPVSH